MAAESFQRSREWGVEQLITANGRNAVVSRSTSLLHWNCIPLTFADGWILDNIHHRVPKSAQQSEGRTYLRAFPAGNPSARLIAIESSPMRVNSGDDAHS
jgi:hypothetical protein